MVSGEKVPPAPGGSRGEELSGDVIALSIT